VTSRQTTIHAMPPFHAADAKRWFDALRKMRFP